LKDLWQLHTVEGPNKTNVADDRIANLASTRPDAGNYLLLTVHPDGVLAVMNQRTGQTVEYPAK
jgi:hypothetical protein